MKISHLAFSCLPAAALLLSPLAAQTQNPARTIHRNATGLTQTPSSSALGSQGQTLGPWNLTPPDSATLISGGGSNFGWLNVVTVPLTLGAAMTSSPIEDAGYANADLGTVVEVTFTGGVTNGPGADLVMLDAQFDVGLYTVRSGFDGFVLATLVDTVGGTSVATSDFYYEHNSSTNLAMIVGVEVDLSSMGVPLGASVTSFRFSCENTGCDPITLARIGQDITGQAYCSGDGSGTQCPCAANGNPGEGCANTSGTGGARLIGLGAASLSADSFVLEVLGVPGAKPGLILRGADQLNSGMGLAIGDGLLCTGMSIARSQIQLTQGGATTFTDFQGSGFCAWSFGSGVPTNYQFWYRDGANTCSGTGFNFSNGWTVTWLP